MCFTWNLVLGIWQNTLLALNWAQCKTLRPCLTWSFLSLRQSRFQPPGWHVKNVTFFLLPCGTCSTCDMESPSCLGVSNCSYGTEVVREKVAWGHMLLNQPRESPSGVGKGVLDSPVPEHEPAAPCGSSSSSRPFPHSFYSVAWVSCACLEAVISFDNYMQQLSLLFWLSFLAFSCFFVILPSVLPSVKKVLWVIIGDIS